KLIVWRERNLSLLFKVFKNKCTATTNLFDLEDINEGFDSFLLRCVVLKCFALRGAVAVLEPPREKAARRVRDAGIIGSLPLLYFLLNSAHAGCGGNRAPDIQHVELRVGSYVSPRTWHGQTFLTRAISGRAVSEFQL